jgi:hypothetical protein
MAGKKGSPHGLPAKTLSEKQRGEVETLAAFLSAEQVADYFGIGRTTFFAIMERDPNIGELYKRGKSKVIAKVAQGLIQKALSGDTASAIFFLKTQARWRETERHEITGADGGPLELARIERVIVDKVKPDGG